MKRTLRQVLAERKQARVYMEEAHERGDNHAVRVYFTAVNDLFVEAATLLGKLDDPRWKAQIKKSRALEAEV